MHDQRSERRRPEELVHQRAGMILLDRSHTLLYLNREATEILSHVEPRRNGRSVTPAGAVRKLLQTLTDRGFAPPGATVIVSGRRRYTCRSFRLAAERRNGKGPLTALLLERIGSQEHALSGLRERFGLSRREAQVTELLVDGLTNKEIAARLGVTPNTVKAFLRTVMLKMNASTRAGVVGQVLASIRSSMKVARRSSAWRAE